MYLNNKEIIYSSNLKFLGILYYSKFKLGHQYTITLSKLNKTLYLIKSSCHPLSIPVLRSVYVTKFESMPKYGYIFVGGGK
jgi:hypothetical protein